MRHFVQSAGLLLALVGGCARPIADPDVQHESLSVSTILERCSAAYGAAHTIQARGRLRTYTANGAMTQPVEWAYAQPDRYRIQIGPDAAMVVGDAWWLYRASDGRFRTPRHTFDQTPLRTVTYMLSYPVNMLEPMILETGPRAFAGAHEDGYERWTMRRVDWRDGAPCYVLDRRSPAGVLGTELRLWIDQDQFLIRAWAMRARRADGESAAVADCWYDRVALNAPVASNAFRAEKPRDIRRAGDSDEGAPSLDE